MGDIDDFAEHLATRVSPDEVDLAPSIAQVLIEKGPDAPELQGSGSTARIGGAGVFGVDPGTFKDVVLSMMTCVGFLVNVLDLTGTRDRFIENARRVLRGDSVAHPSEALEEVDRAAEALGAELARRGHDAALAKTMSRECLLAMLDMPEKARRFVQALERAK